MKKFLSAILLSLSLSGCFYQTVNHQDMLNAARFCGGIDNVVSISTNFAGVEHATCSDNRRSPPLDSLEFPQFKNNQQKDMSSEGEKI